MELGHELRHIEEAVLSAALSKQAAFSYLRTRLRPKDFSLPEHRALWERILRGTLEEGFVVPCPPPEFGELPELCRRIRTEANIREVERLCVNALKALNNGARKQGKEFLRRFVQSAAKVVVPGDGGTVKSPQEWLDDGYAAIERRRLQQGSPILDLGFPKISRAISAEYGHLAILAAETGRGKTAIALNIAANVGVIQGIPTLYINAEMSWEELAIRLYALMSEANLYALRTGAATEADLQKAQGVKDSMKMGNALYITDAMPWISSEDVEALAREHAITSGMRVLVVDYIQRFELDGKEESWEALMEACKGLKSLAQELKVFVVVVAQLAGRGRLAGSSGMLREADTAVFIDEAKDPSKGWTHRLKVVKSRHSPSGTVVKLAMDRASLKIREVEDNADGDCDDEVKRRSPVRGRARKAKANKEPEDDRRMQESLL